MVNQKLTNRYKVFYQNPLNPLTRKNIPLNPLKNSTRKNKNQPQSQSQQPPPPVSRFTVYPPLEEIKIKKKQITRKYPYFIREKTDDEETDDERNKREYLLQKESARI